MSKIKDTVKKNIGQNLLIVVGVVVATMGIIFSSVMCDKNDIMAMQMVPTYKTVIIDGKKYIKINDYGERYIPVTERQEMEIP